MANIYIVKFSLKNGKLNLYGMHSFSLHVLAAEFKYLIFICSFFLLYVWKKKLSDHEKSILNQIETTQV